MIESLRALENVKQFIVYRVEYVGDDIIKRPLDYRTLNIANAHDAAIHTDYKTASAIATLCGSDYGVGFVFTENDPYFFLDIDKCLEPSGQWSPLALSLCELFRGAAIEISRSGKGLHIFGRGIAPAHACKNIPLKLEFYTDKRFVALTGIGAMGNIDTDHTPALKYLIDNYFQTEIFSKAQWTLEPQPGWQGISDDTKLIERMLRSQSAKAALGFGASFKDLWENNTDKFAAVYSDRTSTKAYDESSVDAALAQHLAYWTGNDCRRMQILMMQSKLYRAKWDREDYLPRTILSACSKQKTFHHETPIVPASTTIKPEVKIGSTYLNVEQQLDLFAGCIYICDTHKILIPGGYLLKPEQFRVMFGGYTFLMDNANERVSRNAWECFTESQAFRAPRADSSCFRPDLAPGEIIEDDGRKLVNIYWPINTKSLRGDPSPFLNHLKKLLPDERDRTILLCYMAACVQYKGIKFKWCPIIQGVEGNGKTLLTLCVAAAIGDRYSHFPKASELSTKFNDWMYGNIFIGVEDIYVTEHKQETYEALKTMLTGERLEIEGKGETKITRGVCCNFIINSNHKNGLKKLKNDRRFAPFFTAQQTVDDLKRDGMAGDYFYDLYTWLKNQNGFAIVSEFLANLDIPEEFNPATHCQRAPITTSTQDAIEQSRGGVEQEILEAIEQNISGFRSGWISSTALDILLTRLQLNRRIPHNKRRELLQSLGYDWHPGLNGGRVNDTVLPDNNKPKLYIRTGHITGALTNAAEIARVYTEDQLR